MPPVTRSQCMTSRTMGVVIFFFQTEAGIRYGTVTGVQTCALPICLEGADKPMVAAALQNLIDADLLSPLHIDVLETVRALTAPHKTAPYVTVLRALELGNLAVQDRKSVV